MRSTRREDDDSNAPNLFDVVYDTCCSRGLYICSLSLLHVLHTDAFVFLKLAAPQDFGDAFSYTCHQLPTRSTMRDEGGSKVPNLFDCYVRHRPPSWVNHCGLSSLLPAYTDVLVFLESTGSLGVFDASETMKRSISLTSTFLGPQSRLRDKPLRFYVARPQNGTAILRVSSSSVGKGHQSEIVYT